MLKKVVQTDFDKIFHLMEASFPKDEYRTYTEQKALFAEPCYQIFVLPGDCENTIKAFAAVWEFDEVVFIEHLAVDPGYRNSGIGGRMLAELKELFGKRLCLEVELPETEMASRRIGFYERNGMFLNTYPYMQPSLSKGQKAIPLFIMTSGSVISEEEFLGIKELLYKQVYKQG